MLPPGLAKFFSIATGMKWPEANEDDLRAAGDDYLAIAEKVPELRGYLVDLVNCCRDSFEGQAADAFLLQMRRLIGETGSTDYVSSSGEVAKQLGDFAHKVANQVEYAKWMIIAQLIQLVAQIAWAIAMIPITFGGSIAEIFVAYKVTGELIKQIFIWLLKQLLLHEFLSITTAMVMDGIIQGIQIGKGHKDHWESESFIQSIEMGAINGLLTGPLELLTFGIGKLFGRMFGSGLTKNLLADIKTLAGSDLKGELKSLTTAELDGVLKGLRNAPTSSFQTVLNMVRKDLADQAARTAAKDTLGVTWRRELGELAHTAGESVAQAEKKLDMAALGAVENLGHGFTKVERLSHRMGELFERDLVKQGVDAQLANAAGRLVAARAAAAGGRYAIDLGAFNKLARTLVETAGQAEGKALESLTKRIGNLQNELKGLAGNVAANEAKNLELQGLKDTVKATQDLARSAVGLMDGLHPQTAGQFLYRFGEGVGVWIRGGVQNVLTEGSYNLAFGEEHTFTVSVESFYGGVSMGALGHLGHIAGGPLRLKLQELDLTLPNYARFPLAVVSNLMGHPTALWRSGPEGTEVGGGSSVKPLDGPPTRPENIKLSSNGRPADSESSGEGKAPDGATTKTTGGSNGEEGTTAEVPAPPKPVATVGGEEAVPKLTEFRLPTAEDPHPEPVPLDPSDPLRQVPEGYRTVPTEHEPVPDRRLPGALAFTDGPAHPPRDGARPDHTPAGPAYRYADAPEHVRAEADGTRAEQWRQTQRDLQDAYDAKLSEAAEQHRKDPDNSGHPLDEAAGDRLAEQFAEGSVHFPEHAPADLPAAVRRRAQDMLHEELAARPQDRERILADLDGLVRVAAVRESYVRMARERFEQTLEATGAARLLGDGTGPTRAPAPLPEAALRAVRTATESGFLARAEAEAARLHAVPEGAGENTAEAARAQAEASLKRLTVRLREELALHGDRERALAEADRLVDRAVRDNGWHDRLSAAGRDLLDAAGVTGRPKPSDAAVAEIKKQVRERVIEDFAEITGPLDATGRRRGRAEAVKLFEVALGGHVSGLPHEFAVQLARESAIRRAAAEAEQAAGSWHLQPEHRALAEQFGVTAGDIHRAKEEVVRDLAEALHQQVLEHADRPAVLRRAVEGLTEAGNVRDLLLYRASRAAAHRTAETAAQSAAHEHGVLSEHARDRLTEGHTQRTERAFDELFRTSEDLTSRQEEWGRRRSELDRELVDHAAFERQAAPALREAARAFDDLARPHVLAEDRAAALKRAYGDEFFTRYRELWTLDHFDAVSWQAHERTHEDAFARRAQPRPDEDADRSADEGALTVTDRPAGREGERRTAEAADLIADVLSPHTAGETDGSARDVGEAPRPRSEVAPRSPLGAEEQAAVLHEVNRVMGGPEGRTGLPMASGRHLGFNEPGHNMLRDVVVLSDQLKTFKAEHDEAGVQALHDVAAKKKRPPHLADQPVGSTQKLKTPAELAVLDSVVAAAAEVLDGPLRPDHAAVLMGLELTAPIGRTSTADPEDVRSLAGVLHRRHRIDDAVHRRLQEDPADQEARATLHDAVRRLHAEYLGGRLRLPAPDSGHRAVAAMHELTAGNDRPGRRMTWQVDGSGSAFHQWATGAREAAPPLAEETTLNCWEAVLLTAHHTGLLSEQWIRETYSHSGENWHDHLRSRLLRRDSTTPYTAQSEHARTLPLAGDIVITSNVMNHVALATGRVDEEGRPLVLSFGVADDEGRFTANEVVLVAADEVTLAAADFGPGPWFFHPPADLSTAARLPAPATESAVSRVPQPQPVRPRIDRTPRFVVRSSFDARRFHHEGPVTDLTVRIAVRDGGGHDAEVWEKVVEGVEEHLNQPGYRLANGDRMHVTVVRVDPGQDAHLTVDLVGRDRQMDQSTWWADGHPLDYAHELGHQLGLRDEYRAPDVPHRPDVAGSLIGNPHAPAPEGLRQGGLRERHLQLISAVVGHLDQHPRGGADHRSWDEARNAAAPQLRTHVWVDPVSVPKPPGRDGDQNTVAPRVHDADDNGNGEQPTVNPYQDLVGDDLHAELQAGAAEQALVTLLLEDMNLQPMPATDLFIDTVAESLSAHLATGEPRGTEVFQLLDSLDGVPRNFDRLVVRYAERTGGQDIVLVLNEAAQAGRLGEGAVPRVLDRFGRTDLILPAHLIDISLHPYELAVSGQLRTLLMEPGSADADGVLTLLAPLRGDLRQLWQVLDFQDLGGERSFLEQVESRFPEATELHAYIRNGELWERPIVDEHDALDLFHQLADLQYQTADGSAARVPFGFPDDGCFDRAHLMAVRLTELGVANRKIFVQRQALDSRAELVVDSENAARTGPQGPRQVSWVFHVAVVVDVDINDNGRPEPMVIDPSMADRPLLVDHWMAQMGIGVGTSRHLGDRYAEVVGRLAADLNDPSLTTSDLGFLLGSSNHYFVERQTYFLAGANDANQPGRDEPSGQSLRRSDRFFREQQLTATDNNRASEQTRASEWMHELKSADPTHTNPFHHASGDGQRPEVFRWRDVAPDRGSLYHAVNAVLFRAGGDAVPLRTRSVDWMLEAENLTTVREFARAGGASMDELALTISGTGNWNTAAGDLAPRVVASALGVQLHIHRTGEPDVILNPLDESAPARTIHLQLGADHYSPWVSPDRTVDDVAESLSAHLAAGESRGAEVFRLLDSLDGDPRNFDRLVVRYAERTGGQDIVLVLNEAAQAGRLGEGAVPRVLDRFGRTDLVPPAHLIDVSLHPYELAVSGQLRTLLMGSGQADGVLALIEPLRGDLRQLWQVLDFQDLGGERSFLKQVESRFPEATELHAYIRNGELWERPVVDEHDALDLFHQLSELHYRAADGSDARIPFDFPDDGCYDRAHLMAVRLTELGIANRKIFVQHRTMDGAAGLVVNSQNAARTGMLEPQQVSWGFHVAVVIDVDINDNGRPEPMVIDPSMADRPLLVDHWMAQMGIAVGSSDHLGDHYTEVVGRLFDLLNDPLVVTSSLGFPLGVPTHYFVERQTYFLVGANDANQPGRDEPFGQSLRRSERFFRERQLAATDNNRSSAAARAFDRKLERLLEGSADPEGTDLYHHSSDEDQRPELFRWQDVPPDGDCLYHAVNAVLSPEDGDAAALRTRVVNWMLEAGNLPVVRGFARAFGTSMDELARTIGRTGNWNTVAGDLAPRVVASALGVHLHIHRTGQPDVVLDPLNGVAPAGTVHLQLDADHYSAWVPTQQKRGREDADDGGAGDHGEGPSTRKLKVEPQPMETEEQSPSDTEMQDPSTLPAPPTTGQDGQVVLGRPPVGLGGGDMPVPGPLHERVQGLEHLSGEERRTLAAGQDFLAGLRAELGPEDFAQAAARLLIDVDPRSQQPVAARRTAEALVARMLSNQELAERLVNAGVRVVVVPRDVPMTEVPGFVGFARGTGDGRAWSVVRGSSGNGFVLITEENLLGARTTVGPNLEHPEGYSTSVHELAHTIHEFGLTREQRDLVVQAYRNRNAADSRSELSGEENVTAWPDGGVLDADGNPVGNYSARNQHEFFAQLVTAYFGYNHGNDPMTGLPRNNGADWVRAHVPDLVPVLEHLFGPGSRADHPEAANPISRTEAEEELFDGFREFMANATAQNAPTGRPDQQHVEVGPQPPPARVDRTPRFVVRSSFDARRFEHGGEVHTDLTVRIAFRESGGRDVAAVWEKLVEGVEEHLNAPGYRVAGGDRMHVTVVRVEPGAEAHLTVDLVGRDRQMDQGAWWADAEPLDYVHELGHQLGLRDEYRTADLPHRPDVDGSLVGNPDAPAPQGLRQGGLRERHLQLISSVVGHLDRHPGSGAVHRSWDEARDAAAPQARSHVWVDPVSRPELHGSEHAATEVAPEGRKKNNRFKKIPYRESDAKSEKAVIEQPGYASGDQFGIAVALLLNENLHVVIGRAPAGENGNPLAGDKSRELEAFYKFSGIGDDRIHIAEALSMETREQYDKIKEKVNQILDGGGYVFTPEKPREHVVKTIYYGTEMVSRYFDADSPDMIRKAWKLIDEDGNGIKGEEVGSWLKGRGIDLKPGSKVLVIWSRFTGKKTEWLDVRGRMEHDTSFEGTRQLLRALGDKYDAVIITGDPHPDAGKAGKWRQLLAEMNDNRFHDITGFWGAGESDSVAVRAWTEGMRVGQLRLYDYLGRNHVVQHIGARSGNLEALALIKQSVRYLEEKGASGAYRMTHWHDTRDGLTKLGGVAPGYERIQITVPPTASGRYAKPFDAHRNDLPEPLSYLPTGGANRRHKPAGVYGGERGFDHTSMVEILRALGHGEKFSAEQFDEFHERRISQLRRQFRKVRSEVDLALKSDIHPQEVQRRRGEFHRVVGRLDDIFAVDGLSKGQFEEHYKYLVDKALPEIAHLWRIKRDFEDYSDMSAEGYRIESMSRDGNCLYKALALSGKRGPYSTAELSRDAREMRQDARKWIKENFKHVFDDIVERRGLRIDAMADVEWLVGTSGQWAGKLGDVIPEILAEAFRVRLRIFDGMSSRSYGPEGESVREVSVLLGDGRYSLLRAISSEHTADSLHEDDRSESEGQGDEQPLQRPQTTPRPAGPVVQPPAHGRSLQDAERNPYGWVLDGEMSLPEFRYLVAGPDLTFKIVVHTDQGGRPVIDGELFSVEKMADLIVSLRDNKYWNGKDPLEFDACRLGAEGNDYLGELKTVLRERQISANFHAFTDDVWFAPTFVQREGGPLEELGGRAFVTAAKVGYDGDGRPVISGPGKRVRIEAQREEETEQVPPRLYSVVDLGQVATQLPEHVRFARRGGPSVRVPDEDPGYDGDVESLSGSDSGWFSDSGSEHLESSESEDGSGLSSEDEQGQHQPQPQPRPGPELQPDPELERRELERQSQLERQRKLEREERERELEQRRELERRRLERRELERQSQLERQRQLERKLELERQERERELERQRQLQSEERERELEQRRELERRRLERRELERQSQLERQRRLQREERERELEQRRELERQRLEHQELERQRLERQELERQEPEPEPQPDPEPPAVLDGRHWQYLEGIKIVGEPGPAAVRARVHELLGAAGNDRQVRRQLDGVLDPANFRAKHAEMVNGGWRTTVWVKGRQHELVVTAEAGAWQLRTIGEPDARNTGEGFEVVSQAAHESDPRKVQLTTGQAGLDLAPTHINPINPVLQSVHTVSVALGGASHGTESALKVTTSAVNKVALVGRTDTYASEFTYHVRVIDEQGQELVLPLGDDAPITAEVTAEIPRGSAVNGPRFQWQGWDRPTALPPGAVRPDGGHPLAIRGLHAVRDAVFAALPREQHPDGTAHRAILDFLSTKNVIDGFEHASSWGLHSPHLTFTNGRTGRLRLTLEPLESTVHDLTDSKSVRGAKWSAEQAANRSEGSSRSLGTNHGLSGQVWKSPVSKESKWLTGNLGYGYTASASHGSKGKTTLTLEHGHEEQTRADLVSTTVRFRVRLIEDRLSPGADGLFHSRVTDIPLPEHTTGDVVRISPVREHTEAPAGAPPQQDALITPGLRSRTTYLDVPGSTELVTHVVQYLHTQAPGLLPPPGGRHATALTPQAHANLRSLHEQLSPSALRSAGPDLLEGAFRIVLDAPRLPGFSESAYEILVRADLGDGRLLSTGPATAKEVVTRTVGADKSVSHGGKHAWTLGGTLRTALNPPNTQRAFVTAGFEYSRGNSHQLTTGAETEVKHDFSLETTTDRIAYPVTFGVHIGPLDPRAPRTHLGSEEPQHPLPVGDLVVGVQHVQRTYGLPDELELANLPALHLVRDVDTANFRGRAEEALTSAYTARKDGTEPPDLRDALDVLADRRWLRGIIQASRHGWVNTMDLHVGSGRNRDTVGLSLHTALDMLQYRETLSGEGKLALELKSSTSSATADKKTTAEKGNLGSDFGRFPETPEGLNTSTYQVRGGGKLKGSLGDEYSDTVKEQTSTTRKSAQEGTWHVYEAGATITVKGRVTDADGNVSHGAGVLSENHTVLVLLSDADARAMAATPPAEPVDGAAPGPEPREAHLLQSRVGAGAVVEFHDTNAILREIDSQIRGRQPDGAQPRDPDAALPFAEAFSPHSLSANFDDLVNKGILDYHVQETRTSRIVTRVLVRGVVEGNWHDEQQQSTVEITRRTGIARTVKGNDGKNWTGGGDLNFRPSYGVPRAAEHFGNLTYAPTLGGDLGGGTGHESGVTTKIGHKTSKFGATRLFTARMRFEVTVTRQEHGRYVELDAPVPVTPDRPVKAWVPESMTTAPGAVAPFVPEGDQPVHGPANGEGIMLQQIVVQDSAAWARSLASGHDLVGFDGMNTLLDSAVTLLNAPRPWGDGMLGTLGRNAAKVYEPVHGLVGSMAADAVSAVVPERVLAMAKKAVTSFVADPRLAEEHPLRVESGLPLASQSALRQALSPQTLYAVFHRLKDQGTGYETVALGQDGRTKLRVSLEAIGDVTEIAVRPEGEDELTGTTELESATTGTGTVTWNASPLDFTATTTAPIVTVPANTARYGGTSTFDRPGPVTYAPGTPHGDLPIGEVPHGKTPTEPGKATVAGEQALLCQRVRFTLRRVDGDGPYGDPVPVEGNLYYWAARPTETEAQNTVHAQDGQHERDLQEGHDEGDGQALPQPQPGATQLAAVPHDQDRPGPHGAEPLADHVRTTGPTSDAASLPAHDGVPLSDLGSRANGRYLRSSTEESAGDAAVHEALARTPHRDGEFVVAVQTDPVSKLPVVDGKQVGPVEFARMLLRWKAEGVWNGTDRLVFLACSLGAADGGRYLPKLLDELAGHGVRATARAATGLFWVVPQEGAGASAPGAEGHLVPARQVFRLDGRPMIVPDGPLLEFDSASAPPHEVPVDLPPGYHAAAAQDSTAPTGRAELDGAVHFALPTQVDQRHTVFDEPGYRSHAEQFERELGAWTASDPRALHAAREALRLMAERTGTAESAHLLAGGTLYEVMQAFHERAAAHFRADRPEVPVADDAWHTDLAGRGIRTAAGVSRAAADAVHAYLRLGGSNPGPFARALYGWLLPTGAHTVHEVVAGMRLAGAFPDHGYTDGAGMYRNLPGVPVHELRPTAEGWDGVPIGQVSEHPAPAALTAGLPHERTYLDWAGSSREVDEEVLAETRSRRDMLAETLPAPAPGVKDYQDWMARNGVTDAKQVTGALGHAHFVALYTYTGPAHSLMNVLLKNPGPGAGPVLRGKIAALLAQHHQDGTVLPRSIEDLVAPDGAERQDPWRLADSLDEARLESIRKEMALHGHLLREALELLPPARGTLFRGDGTLEDPSRPTGRPPGPEYHGDVVLHRTFASFSSDESVSLGFMKKYDGAEEYRVLLEVEATGVNGRDIAPFSSHMQEKEVLFLPGARMRVTGRTVLQAEDGVPYVRLKAHEVSAEEDAPADGGVRLPDGRTVPDGQLLAHSITDAAGREFGQALFDEADWASRAELYPELGSVTTFVPRSADGSAVGSPQQVPWDGKHTYFFAAHGGPHGFDLPLADGTTARNVTGSEVGLLLRRKLADLARKVADGPAEEGRGPASITLLSCESAEQAREVARLTGLTVHAPTGRTGVSGEQPTASLYVKAGPDGAAGLFRTFHPEPADDAPAARNDGGRHLDHSADDIANVLNDLVGPEPDNALDVPPVIGQHMPPAAGWLNPANWPPGVTGTQAAEAFFHQSGGWQLAHDHFEAMPRDFRLRYAQLEFHTAIARDQQTAQDRAAALERMTEFVAELDDHHRSALEFYTNPSEDGDGGAADELSYYQIKQAQWTLDLDPGADIAAHPHGPTVLQYIEAIGDAITQCPVTAPLLVSRGAPFVGNWGHPVGLQVGVAVHEPTFVSATVGEQLHGSFAERLIRMHLYVPENVQGAYLPAISVSPEELEILFGSGVTWIPVRIIPPEHPLNVPLDSGERTVLPQNQWVVYGRLEDPLPLSDDEFEYHDQ
nr:protein-glutamine glutaminase family protein [Streptomyces sp. TLI_235]